MESKLPITLDTKPTKIDQECRGCKKQIEKGAYRAKVMSGVCGVYPSYDYYHQRCLENEYNKLEINL